MELQQLSDYKPQEIKREKNDNIEVSPQEIESIKQAIQDKIMTIYLSGCLF